MIPVVVCKDLNCAAHGPTLRRLRRLQLAVVKERSKRAECRKALAAGWARYLDAALHETLEDGTPVLSVVLATNPELRDRLEAALQGTRRGTT